MEVAGREETDFKAGPFPETGIPGLAASFFFGRTKGSAALGRRILMGGGPFEPVGVRAFRSFVGVAMLPVCFQTREAPSEIHVPRS